MLRCQHQSPSPRAKNCLRIRATTPCANTTAPDWMESASTEQWRSSDHQITLTPWPHRWVTMGSRAGGRCTAVTARVEAQVRGQQLGMEATWQVVQSAERGREIQEKYRRRRKSPKGRMRCPNLMRAGETDRYDLQIEIEDEISEERPKWNLNELVWNENVVVQVTVYF